MLRNKKIMIAIIIVLVILIASIFLIGASDGIIPPYDGDSEGDNDSGDGDITLPVAIRIDLPASSTYEISKYGNLGVYSRLHIEGTLYGENLETVEYIEMSWDDGISWCIGRQYTFQEFNEYNYVWDWNMGMTRLGSGNHIFKATAKDASNNALATASVMVVIPEYWVYHFDSRDLPNTGSTVDEVGDYYYKFCMPFETHVGTFNWMHGEIVKIDGSIYIEREGNVGHDFNLNIWNSDTSQWTTVNTFEAGPFGWYEIEVNCKNTYGSWISFAGYEDGSDDITGFVGDIYFKPGTWEYSQNPLSILSSIFMKGDINKPPAVTLG